MKANRIERPRHTGLYVTLAMLAIVGVAVGAVLGYERLRAVCIEQCVVTDMSSQVEISSGRMVHPSTIAEELGLRAGANLATIDFGAKRGQLLAKVPNLRSVRITRHVPDRVVVAAEERTPVARMELRGRAGVSGRVVDTDGMVFFWQRGTQTLPAIRETLPPGTPAGQRITRRVLAALRLIEACREPEFRDVSILEVDVSKPDFLLATLGSYSKLAIAWDGMDEQTPASHAALVGKLEMLRKAIRSGVTPETVIWNATMPDTITADLERKL